VLFPVRNGARSTSVTGRAIFAGAAGAADAELATRILASRKWRKQYVPLVRELTSRTAAGELALGVASAGLAEMTSQMSFERDGGALPLHEAAGAEASARHETLTVTGKGDRVEQLVVPYGARELMGEELLRQLARWESAGTVEPSFASAIAEVIDHPEWLQLPGRRVAVIGAGSEMGPFEPLSSWGAAVLAIDVPSPSIWGRIIAGAEAGAASVAIPLSPGAEPIIERTGIDIARDLPEAAAWIAGAAGEDKLVLGTYAYADGGRHVQVTAAADAIAARLLETRPGTALAYLGTPTDAYIVGPEVVAHARARWANRGAKAALQSPLRVASGGRLFQASYTEELEGEMGVADALVPVQGPNYALAKRLQRWRAVSAQRHDSLVSFNVAPSSWTRSVTRNRVLAAAYGGAGRFGIEIFAPATTRALMAAKLVHDLQQPGAGLADRSHPEALFSEGAAHGGLWRAPYDPRSALGIAALAGLPSTMRKRGGR
jgi:hypothetical protein